MKKEFNSDDLCNVGSLPLRMGDIMEHVLKGLTI